MSGIQGGHYTEKEAAEAEFHALTDEYASKYLKKLSHTEQQARIEKAQRALQHYLENDALLSQLRRENEASRKLITRMQKVGTFGIEIAAKILGIPVP